MTDNEYQIYWREQFQAAQREIAGMAMRQAVLVAELKLARNVADAAVGWGIAHELKMRFIMAEAGGDPTADAAYRAMVAPTFEAQLAFADAVHEYRERCKNVADKKEDAEIASPLVSLSSQ